MGNSPGRFSFIFALLIPLILFLPATSFARDFPLIENKLTDIPDVLTESEETELLKLVDDLKTFNKIRGLIIITQNTEEWDFVEHIHDLFDHARSIGMTDNSGFLIYISTDDRKFALTVGDDLRKVTDETDLREIRNKAGEHLASGNYYSAISYALSRFRTLTGPADLHRARDTRSDFLMLFGLVILVAVLLHNISRRKRILREKGKPDH